MNRMKKIGSILPIALLGTVAILFLVAKSKPESTAFAGVSVADNLPQIVKAIDLDQSFTFCGEALPMNNFDVRERLDRELTVNTYRHSSSMLFIKKTRRYFPTMERILREEGVPTDLKYLAVAESDLRNAVSPAGARGLWQFMKGTGKEYGLEINEEVDERYHLEKATRAAAKYLRSLRNRFGSWGLAAAAYNMGGGNLNRRLQDQRAETYFDLNLNQETARYYFRLVAIKHLIENPRSYGFYMEEDDFYPSLSNYREIEVNEAVTNWGDFAKEHGTSYRLLKVYNPWLRDSKLTNRNKRSYQVRVPTS